MQFLLAAADGTIWNARRYRVAAPSIRIVPWAALASCWPLPQQLLPVSAAGGGRRRCTLAIFSGKIIYNFGIAERLRALRYPIFTGGVVEGNGICNAAFCESAALREKALLGASGLNSLSQSLTALTAPSVREPLARPGTLHFSGELSRHAKGPIPEGAVAVGDWGS